MGLYDPVRGVVTNDYWCSECVFCRRYDLKKNMVTLSAKSQYGTPKVVCHVCRQCFERLCLAAGADPEDFK